LGVLDFQGDRRGTKIVTAEGVRSMFKGRDASILRSIVGDGVYSFFNQLKVNMLD
jgi:hypothetical protein